MTIEKWDFTDLKMGTITEKLRFTTLIFRAIFILGSSVYDDAELDFKCQAVNKML